MKPSTYLVTYKIPVRAASHADAARIALDAVCKSHAPVTATVRQAHNKAQIITLQPA